MGNEVLNKACARHLNNFKIGVFKFCSISFPIKEDIGGRIGSGTFSELCSYCFMLQ